MPLTKEPSHYSAVVDASSARIAPAPNLMHRRRVVGDHITYIGLDVHYQICVAACARRYELLLSLGGIIARLPAVQTAKKVNTMSRVYRRLKALRQPSPDREGKAA